MKRLVGFLALLMAAGFLEAQAPNASQIAGVYVEPTLGAPWTPWTAGGAFGALGTPPSASQIIYAYCQTALGAAWTPCTGAGASSGVSSLNGLTGAVTLAAGSGITLTPSGNTITIAAASLALAFPATVSGTVNSGGIPYFNTTTQMSSSALLTLDAPVLGGGAGAAPFSAPNILIIGPLIEANSSSQPISYQGGSNAAVSSAIGSVTLQGGNQTGAGNASSAGGNSIVKGGDNAGTNAASEAGSVEVTAGQSTAGGLQGLMLLSSAYVKGGGTSTQWNLQCLISQMTVNDCPATPPFILGVALAVNAATVQIHRLASQTPVNASGAVTVGDTVCAGATAGKVTDSGSTAPCTAGFTVGTVLAVSGTYTLPLSGAVTLSTTLPLITIAYIAAPPNIVNNALTLSNSNTGAASGTTFNGSAAVTLSANTLGAGSLANINTWSALNTFSNSPTTGSGAYGTLFSGTPITSSLFNPVVYISPTGATNPTWANESPLLAINAPSGYSTSALEFEIAANGTNVFTITATGVASTALLDATGGTNAIALLNTAGSIDFNGHTNLSSSGANVLNVGAGTTLGAGGSLFDTNTTESGTNNAALYATATNCSSSASPAVCASAASGSAALPTNATSSSIQINTTAVTANSQIFLTSDDTLGTKLGVTCNSTLATLVGGLTVSARTAGTSFTVANNVAVAVNPLCISWFIIN